MDDQSSLLQDQCRSGGAAADDLLIGVKTLMLCHFGEWMTEGSVNQIIKVCFQNGGLFPFPLVNPRALLACWRHYPSLLGAVQEQDWPTLEEHDLRSGPMLYVAAFISPIGAYSLFRDLIRKLNPYAFSFHRRNNRTGEFRFNILKNKAFDFSRWRESDG